MSNCSSALQYVSPYLEQCPILYDKPRYNRIRVYSLLQGEWNTAQVMQHAVIVTYSSR
jgi:hypothetical protein